MKRPPRIKFTPEQLKKIIRDYKGGQTIAQIAEKFDVNPATIKDRLVRNKIKIRKNGEWQKGKKPANYIKVSHKIKKLCVKLWQENYILSEIKNEVGFNENKIRDILISEGIETSRRRRKPANVKCTVCGLRFRKRPSRIKKTNFCSHICRGIYEQKRIAMTCEHCGKEIHVTPYIANKRKFCSHECSVEESKNGNFIECENCGKLFYKSLGKIGKYCSRECMAQARITAVQVECSMCGKKIKKNLCHIEGREYIFCSYGCAFQFRVENEEYGKSIKQKISKARTEYYKTHPEAKNDLRLKMIQRFKEGKFPRTKTIPHKLVCKMLKSLRITFAEEYPTGPFVSDIFLPKYKTVIEVQGTYWHADPRFYSKSELNKTQQYNVKRDTLKRDFIKNDLGLSLIELWEYDITNTYDEVFDFLSSNKSNSFKTIEA
ncbi:MAG: hypothetical protein R2764_18005, partial [Bacteroidales bacterium]